MKNHFPHWVVSVICGVAAMVLVVTASILPTSFARGVLGVGVAVFLVVYFLNPARWYRLLAATIVGSWLSAVALAGLDLYVQWDPDTFAAFVSDTVGWPFHLVAGTLLLVLLALDYMTRSIPMTSTQRGELLVGEAYEYEVFYPQPFLETPNLSFPKQKLGAIPEAPQAGDVTIVEQRNDRFTIKLSGKSSAWKKPLIWKAVGRVSRR